MAPAWVALLVLGAVASDARDCGEHCPAAAVPDPVLLQVGSKPARRGVPEESAVAPPRGAAASPRATAHGPDGAARRGPPRHLHPERPSLLATGSGDVAPIVGLRGDEPFLEKDLTSDANNDLDDFSRKSKYEAPPVREPWDPLWRPQHYVPLSQEMRMFTEDAFAMLDVDGSGALTPDEMGKLPLEAFRTVDTNGDGKVDKQEAVDFHQRELEEWSHTDDLCDKGVDDIKGKDPSETKMKREWWSWYCALAPAEEAYEEATERRNGWKKEQIMNFVKWVQNSSSLVQSKEVANATHEVASATKENN